MNGTDYEQTLRNRFAGEVEGMAPADGLAARARAAGRSRRRRRNRAGLLGAGAAVAAAAVLGVGLPGPSTGGPLQADGNRTRTQTQAETFAFSLAAATTSTPALARVDRYEVTWLPKGIKPYGPVQTSDPFVWPDDPRLRTVTRMQRFSPGGREIAGNQNDTASWLDLQVIRVTKGDAAMVRRAYQRDLADIKKRLEPGDSLVQGTLAGGPAYIRTRHDGVDVDFTSVPDPRTGVIVNVKMHKLTRVEMEAVISGLRVRG